MEQIVLGCITTLKINTIVSQLQKIENRGEPYIGPLDLVVIIDKRIVPVKQDIKINIHSIIALEKMNIKYKYIKEGKIRELSKFDLLPINEMGELILVPETENTQEDKVEDEFTEIHKMLEQYSKDIIQTFPTPENTTDTSEEVTVGETAEPQEPQEKSQEPQASQEELVFDEPGIDNQLLEILSDIPEDLEIEFPEDLEDILEF